MRAVIKHGGVSQASKALGISRACIYRMLARAKNTAVLRGYSPEHNHDKVIPPGYHVKGTSTLYDGDGVPTQQWVKTQVDRDKLKAIAEETARSFFEDRRPLKPIPPPRKSVKGKQAAYVLTDLHLGMLCRTYNVNKAKSLLAGTMAKLVGKTEPTHHAVLAQLGDLFHTDDDTNRTKKSGHPLDVDGFYEDVAAVGVGIYRDTIDLLLQHHKRLTVVNIRGNHDPISAMWLGMALKVAYEKEPRVKIISSPEAYVYYPFGKNLLGFTHGNHCKLEDLPEIMSEAIIQNPEWAPTVYRHWLTGHIHHKRLYESRTCRVESFRCLPDKDAYHRDSGYRSGRDMESIIYHEKYGEDHRQRVGVREVEDS